MRHPSFTAHELEADSLDLDMYRLIGRMRAFAEKVPVADQHWLLKAASSVSFARGPVRAQMHPERRRETANA